MKEVLLLAVAIGVVTAATSSIGDLCLNNTQCTGSSQCCGYNTLLATTGPLLFACIKSPTIGYTCMTSA